MHDFDFWLGAVSIRQIVTIISFIIIWSSSFKKTRTTRIVYKKGFIKISVSRVDLYSMFKFFGAISITTRIAYKKGLDHQSN
jgi:hypothetical protein